MAKTRIPIESTETIPSDAIIYNINSPRYDGLREQAYSRNEQFTKKPEIYSFYSGTRTSIEHPELEVATRIPIMRKTGTCSALCLEEVFDRLNGRSFSNGQ